MEIADRLAMPALADSHPTPAQLAAFALGKLDDAQSTTIEQHLTHCGACTAYLDRESPADEFVALVRRADAARADAERPPSDATVSFEQTARRMAERRTAPALGAGVIPGYEILGELGRGGMGVVYRARHLQLKRDVALKVILSGAHGGSHERLRFLREAETIARLQHVGIVQIFEIGEHEQHPFLALELVEGCSLAAWIQGRPQPIRWSAALLLQVANAVYFAHRHAIVHRDLKPANILLCRPPRMPGAEAETTGGINGAGAMSDAAGADHDGDEPPPVKITDFGLAKQMDSDSQLTRSGVAVGTPAYMAPEQADGRASAATDVYSLGAILYELLTGRPPFVCDDLLQTLRMVIEDDATSPREHRPEITRDLETICLKCLMKEPSQRYESARDLAIDLELFLAHEPIVARPLSVGGRVMRWARHRPLLAGIWLAAALFYGLHLTAMYGLKLPQHDEQFHRLLTGVFGTLATAAYFVQRVIERRRDSDHGQLAFAALVTAAVTVLLAADSGPLSAPTPVYFLMIVGSPLCLPTPRMIWTTTGLSIGSYLTLVLHARWLRPSHVAPTDSVIAFLLSLGMTGVLVHLLLRRSTPMSRGLTSSGASSSGPSPSGPSPGRNR